MDLDGISYASMSAYLLKLVLNVLCQINIQNQRKEFYLRDLIKYTFNICLCSDTYKLISSNSV